MQKNKILKIYTNICSQKSQADLRNPCSLLKIRRIYKIQAPAEKQADFQNSGGPTHKSLFPLLSD
jgi:hypothetical protein